MYISIDLLARSDFTEIRVLVKSKLKMSYLFLAIICDFQIFSTTQIHKIFLRFSLIQPFNLRLSFLHMTLEMMEVLAW